MPQQEKECLDLVAACCPREAGLFIDVNLFSLSISSFLIKK
jgi:hypothetical protein